MLIIERAVGAAALGAIVGWLLAAWRDRGARQLTERWPGSAGSARLSRARIAVAAATLAAVAAVSDANEVKRGGSIATVFVYDTSKSMTANDVSPSRRVAGVRLLRRLLASIEGAAGLVVFAEDAVTVAPLTPDLAAVTGALDEVDATAFRPGEGSTPAPALSVALDMLSSSPSGRVMLISDGEWTDASALDDVLDRAGRMEVPILTIGVGTLEGARLEAGASSEQHLSRVDRDGLSRIATRTRGRSFLVDDTASLDRIDGGRFAAAPSESSVTGAVRNSVLWLAFVLLLPAGPRLRRRRLEMPPHATRLALVAALGCLSIVSCRAEGALLTEGNRQFDRGDYVDAAATFEKADAQDGSSRGIAAFNLGVALGRSGDTDGAAAAFERSNGQLQDAHQRALSAFNRGVALSTLVRLPEAAMAFVDALRLDDTLEDARINLTIVRDRLAGDRSSQPAPSIPPARYVIPRAPSIPSRARVHDW